MVKLILWTAAILGVLFVVSGHPAASRQDGKHTASRAQIGDFHEALKLYHSDVGAFPSEAEGLRALRVNPGKAGWQGPYLQIDIPLDPWGAPYEYRLIEGRPAITYRALLLLQRSGRVDSHGAPGR